MKPAWRDATAVLWMSAALLASVPAPAAASPGQGAAGSTVARTQRILVVQGIDPWLPGVVAQEQAMRHVLSQARGTTIEVLTELVESHYFPRTDLEPALLALLGEKYRDVAIDLIVAVGKPGLDFAARHRAQLWGDAPIVFVGVAPEHLRDRALPARTTGVQAAIDAAPTLALARRLQPDARRVVVVGGVAPTDQLRVQRAVDAARQQGLAVIRLDDLSLPDTLKHLATIPRDSIVFAASMLRDGSGNAHVPSKIVEQLSAAAAAPVYASASSFFGHGVVGGVFNDFAEDGRRVGALALGVLGGNVRPDAPVLEARNAGCSIDGRELHRWDLSHAAVPDECDLQFESHGLLERHRPAFFMGLAVIAFQGVLIALLLAQRRRARAAALETQRMRGELAHAARLATVGELMAAISHELNQPLGAVQSNADAAEMLLDSPEPRLDRVRQVLHDIRAANLRASEVVQRLRALLLKQETRLEAIDLAQVVDAVVALTGHEIARRHVTVSTVVSGRPLVLRGDVVQLQQVLLNLLINAMDAVADNPVERRRVRISARRSGTHAVVVEVADTGYGIAPLDLPRLFESFRSSKKHGMGLGLSISRSIVQAHGGQIAAANNADGGATFTVTLPAARHAAETRAARRLASCWRKA